MLTNTPKIPNFTGRDILQIIFLRAMKKTDKSVLMQIL